MTARYLIITAFISLTQMGLVPLFAADLDHRRAFEQFGQFMNGTWAPAEQDDALGPIQHVYSWTLDQKFMQVDGTEEAEPSWKAVFGIEPASEKLTWWAFWPDGDAGPAYLTEASESHWVFEGERLGPNGKTTRYVTVRKLGEAKLHAKVVNTLGEQETVAIDEEWIRHRAHDSVASAPHDWEYLQGTWQFSNSRGDKARVHFRTAAAGMVGISDWVTERGNRAHETLGWDPRSKRLIVSGYGDSGIHWHVEYTEVSATKCSGPSVVNYSDGARVEGILTIEKVSEDLLKLRTVGTDQDGEDIVLTSQFKRIGQ